MKNHLGQLLLWSSLHWRRRYLAFPSPQRTVSRATDPVPYELSRKSRRMRTVLQRLGEAVLASKPLAYWRMHGKETR